MVGPGIDDGIGFSGGEQESVSFGLEESPGEEEKARKGSASRCEPSTDTKRKSVKAV